ncbi:Thioredoxin domain-containing protein 17, partial [Modicella reniformis]
MPATIVPVPTIDSTHLREVVEQTVKEHSNKDVYLYFYASTDPATGVSWCPDCVTSDPIVKSHFAQLDNTVLIDVPVGDRPTWKNPNNTYRHSEYKINSVPTLLHWKT